MNPEPSNPADQADVIAANERLSAERDTAHRERDEARTALATATAERDRARTDLATATAERDRLTGIDRDFSRRLAAELAKQGIRAEALPLTSAKPAGTDLVAQYQAITDPKERARFLARHGDEIRRLAVAA